ncbi:Hypothetical protein D9617_16g014660 [Elsinoe fawcettii]|nr:Hypothetical protein D9617_16g014660 [Elsinoe fawcettii]
MAYIEGRKLHLALDAYPGYVVEATICEVFSPSTLSCVMRVEVLDIGLSVPRVAVLKLFDRRFSEQLREDQKSKGWSERVESAFASSVSSGEAGRFWWEGEAYLHTFALDFFDSEAQAYKRLGELQGHEIPSLYSTVTLSLPWRDSDSDRTEHELLSANEAVKHWVESLGVVRGILVEYIDGITLADLANTTTIPRHKWQGFVDAAIRNVHKISDHDILNEDVRPSNIMVSLSHEAVEHRMVMLDFALCRFREPEQSDHEWGRAKHTQHEEGAVGVIMRARLAKVGFDLDSRPSGRWWPYAMPETKRTTELTGHRH